MKGKDKKSRPEQEPRHNGEVKSVFKRERTVGGIEVKKMLVGNNQIES